MFMVTYSNVLTCRITTRENRIHKTEKAKKEVKDMPECEKQGTEHEYHKYIKSTPSFSSL